MPSYEVCMALDGVAVAGVACQLCRVGNVWRCQTTGGRLPEPIGCAARSRPARASQEVVPGIEASLATAGPESDSVLTGTEVFRVDRDFVLDVKFMYAAPYRIAAGATRLGAQAAADEGPSFWQVFGYVREASKGPWAESEHDEVLATKLRFVPVGRGR